MKRSETTNQTRVKAAAALAFGLAMSASTLSQAAPPGRGQLDFPMQTYNAPPNYGQQFVQLTAAQTLHLEVFCVDRNGLVLHDGAANRFRLGLGTATNVQEPASGPTITFDLSKGKTEVLEISSLVGESQQGQCYLAFESGEVGPAAGLLGMVEFREWLNGTYVAKGFLALGRR